jgi:hypothetical protein
MAKMRGWVVGDDARQVLVQRVWKVNVESKCTLDVL